MRKTKSKKFLYLIERLIAELDSRHIEIWDDTFFDDFKADIDVLCAYFSCSPMQAVMIVVAFEESKKGDGLDFRAIQGALRFENAEVNGYMDMLDELWIRGIFIKKFVRFGGISPYAREYVLNPIVINALINAASFPADQLTGLDNDLSAIEYLYDLAVLSGNYERMVSDQVLPFLASELSFFEELPFFKQFQEYNLNTRDWSFLLVACWHELMGKPVVEIGELIDLVEGVNSKKLCLYAEFIGGQNQLVKNGLIHITQIQPTVVFELADSVLDLIESIQPRKRREMGNSDLFTFFLPEKIKVKKLIYESGVDDQIHMLENLLQEDKYQEFRQRMDKARLPGGLTMILFGAPGTGKTESVLQLAKATGRAILQINIDAIKSPYLGENEKLTKQIFKDYYRISKKSKRTPILLFNEADALFSTRSAISNTNPVATQINNAVQNILLDEMERFNGILVATTNFLVNFDAAFERRFLFKLSFGEPSIRTLAEIWKIKIPVLNEDQCRNLASHYSLSGGQIDNIVRKMELNEVLFGKPFSMEELEKFCREERFQSTQSTIGYKLNRA